MRKHNLYRILIVIVVLSLASLSCQLVTGRGTNGLVAPTETPAEEELIIPDEIDPEIPAPEWQEEEAPAPTLAPGPIDPGEEDPADEGGQPTTLEANSQPLANGLVLANPAETQLFAQDETIPYINDLVAEEYEDSEWNMVGKTLNFTAQVEKSTQAVLWANGWCTDTQASLKDNLSKMRFEFAVNGEWVDMNTVLWTEYESTSGMYCGTYYQAIYGWPAGATTITFKITFIEPVNDGYDDYPAGEMTRVYNVSLAEGSGPSAFETITDGPIRFEYSTDLFRDYKLSKHPARLNDMTPTPGYIQYDFLGYPISTDTSRGKARIQVFSAAEYVKISPAVEDTIQALKALASGDRLETFPFPPVVYAGQLFQARGTRMELKQGQGYAYLTQYAQDIAPINNESLVYVFAGILGDDTLVVGIFPVNAASLPDTYADAEAGGWTYDYDGYQDYLAGVTDELEGLSADEFTPNLDLLNAMFDSIETNP